MGINVLIGANGSGKSNIAEAICFVLGKASKKELRTERIADVIFNGGRGGKPAKFAKVTLILDNSEKLFPYEGDELRVSRKVDLHGRSTYRINGRRVTRGEVLNALAHAGIDPDGYNIILQGEIERFVDMGSEERSEIIQEIAGISFYEEKKRKSMLELQKVEEKLREAEIRLSEKEGRLRELLQEKDQAEVYLKLKEELRRKRASYLLAKKARLEKREEEISNKASSLRESLLSLSKEISEIKKEFAGKEARVEEITKEIEEKGGAEQLRIRIKIEKLSSKLAEVEEKIERVRGEIKRIDLRKGRMRDELRESQESLGKSKKDKERVEREIRQLLSRISSLEERGSPKKLIQLRDSLDHVESKLLTLKEKRAEAIRAREKKELIRDLSSKLELCKSPRFTILRQIGEKRDGLEYCEKKVEEIDNYIKSLEVELVRIETRRRILSQLVSQAVKEVLRLRDEGKVKGIYGKIAELWSTDQRYWLAISSAIGSKSEWVVVEDEKVAFACIDHLRKSRAGVATFLPLNLISPPSYQLGETLAKPGVIGLAVQLIKFDPRYRKAFELVLGPTIVVENRDAIKRIGFGKARVVTLEGDLTEPTGEIVGGFRTLGFNEERIEAKIKEIEQEIKRFKSYRGKVERERKSLLKEISELGERRRELEVKIENYKERIAEIGKPKFIDLARVEKDLRKLKRERKNLVKKLERLTPSAELQEVLLQLRKRYEELLSQKSSISAKLEVLTREIEELRRAMEEIERERKRFIFELKGIGGEKKKLSRGLSLLLKEERGFGIRLKKLIREREGLRKTMDKLIKRREKLLRERERLGGKLKEFELRRGEIGNRLREIDESLEEFRDLKVELFEETPEKIKGKIRSLERRIREFGPVNLRALDAYRKVEEEHSNLRKRYEELSKEREDILKVIEEVERKKEEKFLRTFEEISSNFQRIFSTLSPGGSAKLLLLDPKQPFLGIDILAEPKGKKLSSMRALSGGEKVLVAISFIFAIQEYQPAPFYIFDEVDPALDKENSERLAALLREYSRNAQFLMISHNDEVVANADNLYGVAMNPRGESQVVSLKLP